MHSYDMWKSILRSMNLFTKTINHRASTPMIIFRIISLTWVIGLFFLCLRQIVKEFPTDSKLRWANVKYGSSPGPACGGGVWWVKARKRNWKIVFISISKMFVIYGVPFVCIMLLSEEEGLPLAEYVFEYLGLSCYLYFYFTTFHMWLPLW